MAKPQAGKHPASGPLAHPGGRSIAQIAANSVIALAIAAGVLVFCASCSGVSADVASDASVQDTAEPASASLGESIPTAETSGGGDPAGTTDTAATATAATAEIVCWGDSMTEGVGAGPAIIANGDETFDASWMSYPEILEELTGITTYNFGVSGATSEEIGFMQGSRQLDHPLRQLNVISGDVMIRALGHKGDVVVLEIGSNGGWHGDYGELAQQYRDMISHAECDRYIIIGDTDDPGTSIADTDQEPFPEGTGAGETTWEATLREQFGEHFINMRAYLVENGLETAGLSSTWQDDRDAAQGRISQQLRADWTHLNSYGYYAQAYAVYEKGKDLGYWS